MIRLHFVVEGQTEELFVQEMLVPELSRSNIFPDVRCVETGRKGGKIYRGGGINRSYLKLKNDLMGWMKQDQHPQAWFTTMIDFYQLAKDFPGYEDSRKCKTSKQRIDVLEDHFQADIGHSRFIPYIQLHEFEALLFADPTKFAMAFPKRETAIQKLVAIKHLFATVEDINEGENTSPSKRIQTIFPEYHKVSIGSRIALKIGLAKIRSESPHFHQWLTKLEQLI